MRRTKKKQRAGRAEQVAGIGPRGRRLFAIWIGIAILALGISAWWVFQSKNTKTQSPGSSQTVFVLEPEAKVLASYAGSASCRACHQSEYERWSQSHHGLAERVIDPKLDQGAFEPARSFSYGSQT